MWWWKREGIPRTRRTTSLLASRVCKWFYSVKNGAFVNWGIFLSVLLFSSRVSFAFFFIPSLSPFLPPSSPPVSLFSQLFRCLPHLAPDSSLERSSGFFPRFHCFPPPRPCCHSLSAVSYSQFCPNSYSTSPPSRTLFSIPRQRCQRE